MPVAQMKHHTMYSTVNAAPMVPWLNLDLAYKRKTHLRIQANPPQQKKIKSYAEIRLLLKISTRSSNIVRCYLSQTITHTTKTLKKQKI
jgi:hypothetical protein